MSETSDATTITEHEGQAVARANATGLKPVVFIHGLWLLPSSWDRWAALFEEAGFTALTPGWPDDPETVEEANAHPEVFAKKTVGQVADHFAEIISKLDQKPVVIGHSFGGLLTQILAGRGLSAAVGRDRPGAVPGRAPAADLGAEVGEPGPAQPRQPQPRRAADLRAVPLRLRQRRLRGRGQGALRDVRRAGRRRAALPGRDREPQPVDRGQGRHQEPGARAAADHLRREGPHRAVGDRQRVVQAAEGQRGRHRDHRDQGAAATRSRSTAAGARSPTPR